MCHAVRFRGSQRPRAILIFAVGSVAIQFMNPGSAFCNRLTGSSLIPVVVLLATPSPDGVGDNPWHEKRRHRFVTAHWVTGRAGRQA
jgi:hypothetical protein